MDARLDSVNGVSWHPTETGRAACVRLVRLLSVDCHGWAVSKDAHGN
jgi:hypothetical protein